MAGPGNILERIVAQKRIELARLPAQSVTADLLQDAVKQHGPRRNFLQAIASPPPPTVSLIAEIKQASPSAGVICKNFDPVQIAREYEAAGAHCLSVLTDEQFFRGSLADLKRVRAAVRLPLLRKDFLIDARQILEAIVWGADAILLIAAILEDEQLRHYQELARAAGLTALVEVHDETELRRAIAAKAQLIGINNRDLKTFRVDLATTEQLARRLRENPQGPGKFLVAESGIHTRADVDRLHACGACAILVGESLLRGGQIGCKVRELLGR